MYAVRGADVFVILHGIFGGEDISLYGIVTSHRHSHSAWADIQRSHFPLLSQHNTHDRRFFDQTVKTMFHSPRSDTFVMSSSNHANTETSLRSSFHVATRNELYNHEEKGHQEHFFETTSSRKQSLHTRHENIRLLDIPLPSLFTESISDSSDDSNAGCPHHTSKHCSSPMMNSTRRRRRKGRSGKRRHKPNTNPSISRSHSDDGLLLRPFPLGLGTIPESPLARSQSDEGAVNRWEATSPRKESYRSPRRTTHEISTKIDSPPLLRRRESSPEPPLCRGAEEGNATASTTSKQSHHFSD